MTQWAESAESLDLAARLTAIDGTLGIGAYHTGGPRSVDMQFLNYKAIAAVCLHERKTDCQTRCCEQAFARLSTGRWEFRDLPHKVYRLDQFGLAQEEILAKPGGFIKGLIDCTTWE